MKKIIVMTLCLFTTSIKPALFTAFEYYCCPEAGAAIAADFIDGFDSRNPVHRNAINHGACCTTALLAAADCSIAIKLTNNANPTMCDSLLNPQLCHCLTNDCCCATGICCCLMAASIMPIVLAQRVNQNRINPGQMQ